MSTSVSVEKIQELVGRQLGIRSVKADDDLMADLGVESVDFLNLVGVLEESFDIKVSSQELATLKTVRDLHTLLLGKV